MSIHVFIFRRDLRLDDNNVLVQLANDIATTDVILPVFIFNKRQIDPKLNPYFSNKTVEFLIKSLIDLETQIKAHSKSAKLFTFETDNNDVLILDKLLKKLDIKTVAFNSDITPFARTRDAEIAKWCQNNHVNLLTNLDDYTLINPSKMEKPYQVFTPYYKKYLHMLKSMTITPFPKSAHFAKSSLIKTPSIDQAIKYFSPSVKLTFEPGRKNAMNILDNIRAKSFKDYKDERDLVYLQNGTTHLSAYLKYGSISVREAAQAAIDAHGINHELVRQFVWRSFYDQVVYHFPRTLEGQTRKDYYNKSLREAYDQIKWTTNKKHFEAWCNGTTGFPIVDAGMRQMNNTGYMHNRVRMIVASFLVKDLMIDWRKGEQYFATKLVDYYPSANNQGWTFASGSGADAQQYNRIFNPWLQSSKFDADCKYIKLWVPELASVETKHIHNWFKFHTQYTTINYPAPIVDHSIQSKETKELYKQYLYKS